MADCRTRPTGTGIAQTQSDGWFGRLLEIACYRPPWTSLAGRTDRRVGATAAVVLAQQIAQRAATPSAESVLVKRGAVELARAECSREVLRPERHLGDRQRAILLECPLDWTSLSRQLKPLLS